MKISEMRDLPLQELKDKEKELSEDLFNLKIRHSLSRLDNPLRMRVVRRELARVKTLLAELHKQDQ